MGNIQRTAVGVTEGDTRSLDYGSHGTQEPLSSGKGLRGMKETMPEKLDMCKS